MEYFVSPDGAEGNDGSAASPWPLSRGIAELQPGDVLYLRGGTYVGRVLLQGKHAEPSNPIVIRSFPGEHATIDGAIDDFRVVPNTRWAGPGANDEYVSIDTYPHSESSGDRARGSFLERVPYTRLISYSRLEDLQADNQLFGPIPTGDALDGPEAVNPPDPHLPRRPWVYMGPGLFQEDSGEHAGRIHIRLSPTSNNVPGFPDYAGPSDPRQLPLAIWTSNQATLLVLECESVYLENLTVRYGTRTVRVEESTDIRFDHVTVLAGPYGVELGQECHGTTMTHCLVDGGLPAWYFRSDRKDGYNFLLNGVSTPNGLGETTVRALLRGTGSCTDTKIGYCEFVNGHDLLLFGTRLDFSRNWVSNLNDEALYAETVGITALRIFENVIEQSLSGISFASHEAPGNGVSVYRNLFDLRRPTAGIRRRPNENPADPLTPPLRQGQFFKSNPPDGPLDLFHNTILVKDQTIASSFSHFRMDPESKECHLTRRVFNNVLVAVNTVPGSELPISWLPNPNWPAAIAGNCYYRAGEFNDGNELLRHFKYRFPDVAGGTDVAGRAFSSLVELRGGNPPPPLPSDIFTHSRILHPPGFEVSSIAEDPRFRHFDPAHNGPSGDDFRLRWDSPARQHGVVLPDELRTLDDAPPHEAPDIGCFRLGSSPLAVGVDARRQFPQT
jgi:hypothetical protein